MNSFYCSLKMQCILHMNAELIQILNKCHVKGVGKSPWWNLMLGTS